MLQVSVPCSQSCNSTTGNISSGSMNFLCMVLITEKLAEKKIPRKTNWAGNIFKTPWLLTVKLACGIFVLRSSQRIWRTRDIFWINLREQRISILLRGALTNPFSETTECNKGEKVKFSRDQGNTLFSGGSRERVILVWINHRYPPGRLSFLILLLQSYIPPPFWLHPNFCIHFLLFQVLTHVSRTPPIFGKTADNVNKIANQRSYPTWRAAGHNFEVPGYWRFTTVSIF